MLNQGHRHVSNIDCLTVHTTCLDCFISTVQQPQQKKRKEKKPIKTGAGSGHITNLKQSILETFYIYNQGTLNIDIYG
jgi:hypothetical protein